MGPYLLLEVIIRIIWLEREGMIWNQLVMMMNLRVLHGGGSHWITHLVTTGSVGELTSRRANLDVVEVINSILNI